MQECVIDWYDSYARGPLNSMHTVKPAGMFSAVFGAAATGWCKLDIDFCIKPSGRTKLILDTLLREWQFGIALKPLWCNTTMNLRGLVLIWLFQATAYPGLHIDFMGYKGHFNLIRWSYSIHEKKNPNVPKKQSVGCIISMRKRWIPFTHRLVYIS